MIYLDWHVTFSFLYTLWTVDHTWRTVDLDYLSCVILLGRSQFTISRSSFTLLAMSIFPSYIPYVWSIILDQSMRFFSKAVIFFPFDMVSDPSIVIYLTHKGGHFSPKSWNIFRMLPKHMCDRPPRISDFCSQVFIYDFLLKLVKKSQFLLKNSKKWNLRKWPLEVK